MDEQQMNDNNNMEGGGHEGNPMPQENVAPPEGGMPQPEPAKKSYGPIIGIVIIVILLIFAGFYFWGGSLEEAEEREDDAKEEAMEENNEASPQGGSDGGGAAGTVEEGSPDAGTFDDTAMEEVPLSESDEIEDLEAELDSTIIDELDAELEDIDAELGL